MLVHDALLMDDGDCMADMLLQNSMPLQMRLWTGALRCAALRCAALCCAVLCCAVLRCAVLYQM